MCFAGTTVTRGRAKGIAVSTGQKTIIGELAKEAVSSEKGKPPLLIRMEKFTHFVGIAVLVLATIAGLIGIFLRGFTVEDMVFFSIALAVSSISEGLPVSMTVALSVATNRMSKIGVIVRRLIAVEGLGSYTLIATDKTGTLTENELTIKNISLPSGELLEVTGQGYKPVGGDNKK